MATLTIVAGVALTAFSAGALSGAFFWRRYMEEKMTAPPRPVAASTPLLWDVHSLLNAMNRFAVAVERGGAIDPALVYNLSDYLLYSSLLQRESGWADHHTLDNWLQAYLRILAERKGHSDVPAVSMKLSEQIHRIEVNEVIHQLHWLLHRMSAIASVEIRANPDISNHTAAVTVVIHGQIEGLDPAMVADSATVWRLDESSCSCDFHVDCELHSAVEGTLH